MSSDETLRFEADALRRADGSPANWPQLAVIGDPVGHSLSPTLHAAALRAHALTDHYAKIEVAPTLLVAFLDASLAADMRGFNLTLPHKTAVLAAGCRAAEEVIRIGAANTLVRRGAQWVAHNTDARGFALALQRWRGRALERTLREVVVVGAGGAARAVHAALVDLGARRVRVAARRPERARWVEASGGELETLEDLRLGAATLVVQCTPLGWSAGDPSPLPAAEWHAETAAFDLGYGANRSRFLRDAEAAGAPACDGLAMLVAQAALAFTMWYGGESPLRAMAASVHLDW